MSYASSFFKVNYLLQVIVGCSLCWRVSASNSCALFCSFSRPDMVIMRGRGSGGAISAARPMHLELSYLYKRNRLRSDSPSSVCL